MKLFRLGASLVIALLALAAARADDEVLTPLFNGQDLSGWVNVNCAPGTFTVRDNMIISTGIPTGVLRTERQYENFILEIEWRHMVPKGNAGLFVWSDPVTARGQPFTRSVEVQILDGRNSETHTSHGDVFSIHGATLKPDRPHPRGSMRCLPSERRAKPAGEWNHYRVVCNDGVLKLAVNGKVVSGASECRPRKGYICLEAEGSECHFRNLRIKELPSTNATVEETADVARGFRSLYTGVDLSGWTTSREGSSPAEPGAWRVQNWRLAFAGGKGSKHDDLWTEQTYRDFTLICDWRWKGKQAEPTDAGRPGIFLRGDESRHVAISRASGGSGSTRYLRAPGEILPLVKADEPLGRWNRFVITLRRDELLVELNGQVTYKTSLSGIPPRGKIGLRGDGAMEFAIIYVRELE